jgi:endonuclease/exonuclease/phosphatase family metal-dependent hydrolase/protein tyrosine phosphatase (PTP) superfamily phosphohydrolase (DUF442 family)
MRPRFTVLMLAGVLLTASSCTRTLNYAAPAAPRYAGTAAAPSDPEDAIRVVTFNVECAEHIDAAIALLRQAPELRGADLIFLQEMDAPAVQRIAESLGLHWVYYPAVVHPKHERDFGNAILSRWPIEGDRKIILPHRARIGRSQRIAVAGTVTIRGEPIRVYSIHLALPVQVGPGGRREQAEAIIADAQSGPGRVIVAGDLNWKGVGEAFERAGFAWPTRGLGRTTKIFDVDHIFLRGFRAARTPPTGRVEDNRGASDHRPVWGVFAPDTLPPTPRELRRPARRDASLGIEAAAWIDSTLVRGARPGEKGLAALAARGFHTVVNLTRDDEERDQARQLGLDYFEIPLTAHLWSSPPTEDQVRRFFALVLDPERRPLYVHCRHGHDRTGMMVALYRMETQGWPAVDAVEEMQAFDYNDWYRDPIGYVRRYLRRAYAPEGEGCRVP